VPCRGPATRYELPGGKYETIPENKGIRCFVMEHFKNVNRVVHRMKYAGGTFSGYKSMICAAEITVVGHLCTYEGRKPETDRVKVIDNWGPCKNLHDVRAFLGIVGVCTMFIENFEKKAEPINDLLYLTLPLVFPPESRRLLDSHCSLGKVQGLDTHHIVHGWWWCALIGFCAAWCVALATVMVVLSLLKGEGGGSFMSLIVIMCPCCVVVPCPPHCCPMMLLLLCPHCDVLFDCNVTVGDMAPVLKR